MNLASVAGLTVTVLPSSTWYRAVEVAHWQNPLGYTHTASAITRFNGGNNYFILYLAPDPVTALLEVQALARSIHAANPVSIAPHRYAVFPISVGGVNVVDLGDFQERTRLATTAQELTGNWRSYPGQGPTGAIGYVRHSGQRQAPTQALGAALAGQTTIQGFLSPSAQNPLKSNLMLFPNGLTIDWQGLTITGTATP